MKYKYQLLKQDGTSEDLETLSTNMEYERIKEALSCQMIEVIPQDYHPDNNPNAIYIGDEEGRFNLENHRNPHFKVLRDADGNPWDVVGDILMEVKYNGK